MAQAAPLHQFTDSVHVDHEVRARVWPTGVSFPTCTVAPIAGRRTARTSIARWLVTRHSNAASGAYRTQIQTVCCKGILPIDLGWGHGYDFGEHITVPEPESRHR